MMYDYQNNAHAPDPKLVGIFGWLLLPAIGLVFGFIRLALDLVALFVMMSEALDAGYAEVHALTFIAEAVLFLFLIYAAIRFFGKKKNAPRVMIMMYALQLVLGVLIFLVARGTGADLYAEEASYALYGSALTAIIWIPYFQVSERVKATFVK